MRARLVVACSALLMVLVLWMTGAGSRRISAQAAPAAKKLFLEVGKRYEFRYEGAASISGLVLEEPRERWVRIGEVLEDRKTWVNLDRIVFILEK